MPTDFYTGLIAAEDDDSRPSLTSRLKTAGRQILDDPGVKTGLAQIVASLCAMAVRAVSSKTTALVHRQREHE